MFREKRQFRAIILHAPRYRSIDDLMGMLPGPQFASQTELPSPSDTMSVFHLFYLTESVFVDADTLAAIQVKRGRKKYYQYDMYIAVYRYARKAYFLIAAPFSKMAFELFQVVNSSTQSQSRSYEIADLMAISQFLESNKQHASRFSATNVRFDVVGDSDVNSIRVAGSNVLLSRTLSRAKKELHGIELVPKRMRVAHDGESGRFVCEFDPFGSFWFRVTAEGRSIFRSASFFETLHSEKLIQEDSTFPLRRSVQELEEATDDV